MRLNRREVIQTLQKFGSKYNIQFTLDNMIEYYQAKHKSVKSLRKTLFSDFDIPK